jgi:hypothetical protein
VEGEESRAFRIEEVSGEKPMTESEWLHATDPQVMLHFLGGKATDRKLRLIAVACCRGTLNWVRDERSRKAVEVAERFADGRAGREELDTAYSTAEAAFYHTAQLVGGGDPTFPGDAVLAYFAAWYTVMPAAGEAAVGAAAMSSPGYLWNEPEETIRRRQCDLVREVIGNPFRRLEIAPSWRTPDVVALAGHVYYDRAFGRMPELADTLEDAGYGDEDILSHLRGPGPHVRGCWVVDLIHAKR